MLREGLPTHHKLEAVEVAAKADEANQRVRGHFVVEEGETVAEVLHRPPHGQEGGHDPKDSPRVGLHKITVGIQTARND